MTMPSVNPSDPRAPLAGQGDTHVDRLNALWKLSVQAGLSDAERIRAMLAMAAKVLDMDLVVLGEFGEDYTARYVSDRLGVFPEGTVLPVGVALCHVVHQARTPSHFSDLATHPLHAQDPLVTELGMQTYSGIPVQAGEEARWVLAFLRRCADSPPAAVDIAPRAAGVADGGTAIRERRRRLVLRPNDPAPGGVDVAPALGDHHGRETLVERQRNEILRRDHLAPVGIDIAEDAVPGVLRAIARGKDQCPRQRHQQVTQPSMSGPHG